MEATAKAKYVKQSARKIRQVVDLVRGKPVNQALNALHFTPKKAATTVEKTIMSAVSNYMNTDEGAAMDPDNLVISEIYVDEGPTQKRYQPRAMGRATVIRKRSSHLTVVVSDGIEEKTESN
ncbi:MAG: 50S ribosomal protein L22 [Candidatus Marinimicrobia bacterium]|nr:50S ribosomal protein L22 [Candidatus Neomarinimicrobiota bacterium]MCF7827477.1 50S ribosomal protein L22 [Candidatus Neomarinimicrobiota bacterium]MCF7882393.1 50S ribosomal protein L22 [Candidatus Neomarinimicrobiota bacterium]